MVATVIKEHVIKHVNRLSNILTCENVIKQTGKPHVPWQVLIEDRKTLLSFQPEDTEEIVSFHTIRDIFFTFKN